MAPAEGIKKRKQPSQTKDGPEHSSSEVEFTIRDLEGQSSAQSDYDGSDFVEEVDEDNHEDPEELESDEIPSDEDEEDAEEPLTVTNGQEHSLEKDSKANFSIETDANGNQRYVYKEIDPAYDSDDSDAPANANTIGNIPLSFYDAYPHIGYDINGKRIMRPAKGEALDALLDTVEIPKGWTGLTDPATGKPLQLSQEELEVLRKIRMDEVPEEGYDPYPVRLSILDDNKELLLIF